MTKKTTLQTLKVQKNTELVSLLVSRLLEMEKGERIRLTPLRDSIMMSNNSHPHFDSIEKKLFEAMLWQEIMPYFKFYAFNGRIKEIERVSEEEEQLKSDKLFEDINEIKRRLSSLEKKKK